MNPEVFPADKRTDAKTLTPPVTVFSVYYNRETCVAESVESLVNQSYGQMRIVLVDDGSSDSTLERLRAFEGQSQVEVVSGRNQGLTSTLKSVIAQYADSELIAIHGSGDVSLPTRIEKQATALARHPEWVGVGCWVDNIDENGIGRPYRRRERALSGLDLLERNYFTHGEMMFRRDAYDAMGGYRIAFPFAQDIDLWLRLSTLGPFGFVSEPLYQRFIRRDGIERNNERKIFQIALAHAARKNFLMRMACGKDAIDLFGPDATYLLSGDKGYADQLDVLLRREEVRDSHLEPALRAMQAINRYGNHRWLLALWLRSLFFRKVLGRLGRYHRKFETALNRSIQPESMKIG